MNPESPLNSVNPFYLDKVVDLSKERDIEVSDDIYSANGVKLLAKGAKVSDAVRERLIRHKLLKPLEACLTVSGALGNNDLIAMCDAVLEQDGPIQQLLGTVEERQLVRKLFADMPVNTAMAMILTIVERGGADEMKICVEEAVMASVLGKKMGLSNDALMNLAIAGLLHDIGELYINPDYLRNTTELSPSEWRHVVAHPLIGRVLIDELGSYPPAVAVAIMEHHERQDGSGYPRRVALPNLSVEGVTLGVADSLCAIFRHQARPLVRSRIALRIIPGLFPAKLVDFLSENMQLLEDKLQSANVPPAGAAVEGVGRLLARKTIIFNALEQVRAIDAVSNDKVADQIVLHAMQRINVIQRAFSSTGLDAWPKEEQLLSLQESDEEMRFEIAVITQEIAWRFRELARDLQLRVESVPESLRGAFDQLIGALSARQ